MSSTTAPDRPDQSGRAASAPTDVALVAVFAALVTVLSVAAVSLAGGVPITLQTLGVLLAGLVLGPVRGFLAVLLYLIVGFAGLPVFAQGAAGFAVLGGPTAGYLLSFPFAAFVAGLLARLLFRTRLPRLVPLLLAGLGASLVIIYPAGLAGLVLNADMTLSAAWVVNLAFVPGDLLKVLIAAGLALTVFKAFPDLMLPRRRLPVEEPVAS